MRLEEYKRKYINYKNSNLMDPILVEDKDMQFPVNSILHYVTIAEEVTYPKCNKDSLLKHYEGSIVYPIVKYSADTDIIGNPKIQNSKLSSIVTAARKDSPGLRSLKPGAKMIKLSKTKLLIINYGIINTQYRYTMTPMISYYKWYNVFSTVIDTIVSGKNNTDRHNFLTINIPFKIPTIMKLNEYADKINNSSITKLFTTYDHFNVVDLWRYMDVDLHKTSILSKVPNNVSDNITLILRYDEYTTMIGLRDLKSMVKDHGIKSKLQAMSDTTAKKVLYHLLLKLMSKNINSELEETGITGTIEPVTTAPDTVIDIDGKLDSIGDDNIEVEGTSNEIDMSVFDDGVELDGVDVIDDLDVEAYKNMNELLNKDHDHDTDMVGKASILRDRKVITGNAYKKITAKMEERDSAKSPYGGESLKELLDVDQLILDGKSLDASIPDTYTVTDKHMLFDNIGTADKHYNGKILKKDIANTVMGIEYNDNVVNNYKIETISTFEGDYEWHSFDVTDIKGNTVAQKIKLPVVNEDGIFMNGGKEYKMRKQRVDIPIKKIRATQVALTTFYGKLFVDKAKQKKNDRSYALRRKLVQLSADETSGISSLILIGTDLIDKKLPNDYIDIARYIKAFKVRGTRFWFSYDDRDSILPKTRSIKDLEPTGMILIGLNSKGKELFMDMAGMVYTNNDILEAKGDIYDMMGIDRYSLPMEYASLKIFKKNIPLVLILSFYLKLTSVMKLLKVKYEKVGPRDRVSSDSVSYVIKFKDYKLIIYRDDGIGDIILGGLTDMENVTKELALSALDSNDMLEFIFNKMSIPTTYVTEVKMLENMFVDHITKRHLIDLKLPTTFKGMLIKASEMLLDSNYVNPNDNSTKMTIGYERLSGMIYNTTVAAMKKKENEALYGKARLNINPYAAMTLLSGDSTVGLVEDLNPISELNQTEEVTYLGHGGRTIESMNKQSRGVHHSEIGHVSEATKDGKNVGVTASMSANPVKDGEEFSFSKHGWPAVLSTSALLSAGAINDDLKRVNFISRQNVHTVPMNNMRAPYVRSGYETLISSRMGDKHIITSKDDGVVDKVGSKKIQVTYTSAEDKKVTKANYTMKTWNSKEESGISYKNEVVANVVEGQKIQKGTVLAYNKAYFEPDIFDPARVIYRVGANVNVMLTEDSVTYEDSMALNVDMSKKLGLEYSKSRSKIFDGTDVLKDLIEVGTKVNTDTPMYTIVNATTTNIVGMDKESKETLNKLNNKESVAGIKGTVDKVTLLYNAELEELSPSVRALAERTDKELRLNTGKDISGQVSSSYKINGKPLLPGTVELKIYINVSETMGTGDKAILGLQLKATVGDTFVDDPTADDGTKIDAIFSTKSLEARIVTSPKRIGTAGLLLEDTTKKIVATYFK